MRVLDVGCGVGGPAREIARFADVKIVGVNNNDFQIQRARRYTKQAGLEGQVEFAKGDFMGLAEMFGPESFDAGEYLLDLEKKIEMVDAIYRSLCDRSDSPCTQLRRHLRRDLQGSQARRCRKSTHATQ